MHIRVYFLFFLMSISTFADQRVKLISHRVDNSFHVLTPLHVKFPEMKSWKIVYRVLDSAEVGKDFPFEIVEEDRTFYGFFNREFEEDHPWKFLAKKEFALQTGASLNLQNSSLSAQKSAQKAWANAVEKKAIANFDFKVWEQTLKENYEERLIYTYYFLQDLNLAKYVGLYDEFTLDDVDDDEVVEFGIMAETPKGDSLVSIMHLFDLKEIKSLTQKFQVVGASARSGVNLLSEFQIKDVQDLDMLVTQIQIFDENKEKYSAPSICRVTGENQIKCLTPLEHQPQKDLKLIYKMTSIFDDVLYEDSIRYSQDELKPKNYQPAKVTSARVSNDTLFLSWQVDSLLHKESVAFGLKFKESDPEASFNQIDLPKDTQSVFIKMPKKYMGYLYQGNLYHNTKHQQFKSKTFPFQYQIPAGLLRVNELIGSLNSSRDSVYFDWKISEELREIPHLRYQFFLEDETQKIAIDSLCSSKKNRCAVPVSLEKDLALKFSVHLWIAKESRVFTTSFRYQTPRPAKPLITSVDDQHLSVKIHWEYPDTALTPRFFRIQANQQAIVDSLSNQSRSATIPKTDRPQFLAVEAVFDSAFSSTLSPSEMVGDNRGLADINLDSLIRSEVSPEGLTLTWSKESFKGILSFAFHSIEAKGPKSKENKFFSTKENVFLEWPNFGFGDSLVFFVDNELYIDGQAWHGPKIKRVYYRPLKTLAPPLELAIEKTEKGWRLSWKNPASAEDHDIILRFKEREIRLAKGTENYLLEKLEKGAYKFDLRLVSKVTGKESSPAHLVYYVP